ncbi:MULTISPECIES: MerR family transcriptional regulator [Enterococcus]|uniref:HTH merR-type domain-containing protein n=1 Tax=Enterococcus sulfureus ATCC 49903 TaxID=1140003 RepID=S0KM78_9ENTE|nr:MerR family transcriptional regulator [Enterococcus sulfureus]EOT45884.1 hypothetical protein OMY_01905 [Enterococcus sulfureus ATCC 49903]EOT83065.1 hypothetical protein I573_02178 [Enterococcus sulfureus ATCC 49903]
MYSIHELAVLSGVSKRTLRYYHELNLLLPEQVTDKGYRVYTTKQVDQLQQILFYKQFGFSLEQIKQLLVEEEENKNKMLEQQYRRLKAEKEHLDTLLQTLSKTIEYQKGEIFMTDQEKFLGLKAQRLQDYEMHYETESRERYGDQLVDQTKEKFSRLTLEAYQTSEAIENQLILYLQQASLTDKEKQEVVALHAKWLTQSAPFYTTEYHRQLAELYRLDDRFQSYYDQKAGDGAAKRLSSIIKEILI